MTTQKIASIELLRNKTIVIVDDEEDIRDLLADVFIAEGCIVHQADSGNTAFELIKSLPKVDGVISDIRMPDGDGVELLENIRARDPNIPMLMFVTGNSTLTIEDALAKGAHGMINKPFDINVLKTLVVDMLKPLDQRWASKKPRKDADFWVDYRFEQLPSATRGRVLNIGKGGLFLKTETLFPKVKDLVEFKITFSENEMVLQGKGLVRWVRPEQQKELPPGFGLEFFELPEDSINFIEEYLDSNQILSYIPKY